MPLTNFEFGEEEIDGTIIIKAYDSKQLVVAFIRGGKIAQTGSILAVRTA
jgi:hypothetical protein